MTPSVGRIVHYVSYGTPGGEYPSVCRGAVIVAVHIDPRIEATGNYFVDLCVLNPEGIFFNKGVQYDESHRGGTWHWPEEQAS
jgi:hypothetical protein